MFIAAFLAGSVLPFSSEVVMAGLQAAGLNAVQLVIWASVGNVLGGMCNYAVGRAGKTEWMERYLHIKKEKLDKTLEYTKGKGAWMGLFSAVPVIGDVITVALGYMRCNVFVTFVCIVIGKTLRYILIAAGVGAIDG